MREKQEKSTDVRIAGRMEIYNDRTLVLRLIKESYLWNENMEVDLHDTLSVGVPEWDEGAQQPQCEAIVTYLRWR